VIPFSAFALHCLEALTPCCVVLHRFIPYAGQVTIIMNDFPQMKFLVLGALALFILVHRE